MGHFYNAANTHAIDDQHGTLNGECSWASTVYMEDDDLYACTGTLIGDGVFLTAAHCGEIEFARFGGSGNLDSGNQHEYHVEIDHCERRLDYSDDYSNGIHNPDGPDVQICFAQEGETIPNVPIIPVMVPDGEAVDWLVSKIAKDQVDLYGLLFYDDYDNLVDIFDFPLVDVVGTGCNETDWEGDCESRGNKYELANGMVLTDQIALLGTSTKLDILTELKEWWSDGQAEHGNDWLEPRAVATSGDSGGPTYLRLRDGSLRQIGVHSKSGRGVLDEAAPSYLQWIELVADQDLTPCHSKFSDYGTYWWNGGTGAGCEGGFPMNAGEDYGSWDNDCADVTYGGGANEGATTGWPFPGDKAPPPMPENDGNVIAMATMPDIYESVIRGIEGGEYGSSPSYESIESAFRAQAAEHSHSAFLGRVRHVGGDGYYDSEDVQGDFDGDGVAETVKLYPYWDEGLGRIAVLDGEETTWLDRDTSGVLGVARRGAHFGAAASSIDIDGDGYDDLVVSAPGDMGGDSQVASGTISIFYGSETGLTTSGDQLIDQDTWGIKGAAEPGDQLGDALATGDFNCDGYGDIAIGVSHENIGSTRHDGGAINVIYGSPYGLSTVDSMFHQNTRGVDGRDETGDRFGAALVAGNFNSDGSTQCTDLAVGVPGEDVGSIADAGAVYVMFGDSRGITTSGDERIKQSNEDVPGSATQGHRLGSKLETQVDANGLEQIVAYAPGSGCGDSSGSTVETFRIPTTFDGPDIGGTTSVCETHESAFRSDKHGAFDRVVREQTLRALEATGTPITGQLPE